MLGLNEDEIRKLIEKDKPKSCMMPEPDNLTKSDILKLIIANNIKIESQLNDKGINLQ
jgi:hypothetical protein